MIDLQFFTFVSTSKTEINRDWFPWIYDCLPEGLIFKRGRTGVVQSGNLSHKLSWEFIVC